MFSALTVLGWSTDISGSKVKAIGFTALLEGIMMAADAGWLSEIALAYLVALNAVANGCRLAMRDHAAAGGSDWAANLARGIAVAGPLRQCWQRKVPDACGSGQAAGGQTFRSLAPCG